MLFLKHKTSLFAWNCKKSGEKFKIQNFLFNMVENVVITDSWETNEETQAKIVKSASFAG